jgi:hypothetical protein
MNERLPILRNIFSTIFLFCVAPLLLLAGLLYLIYAVVAYI